MYWSLSENNQKFKQQKMSFIEPYEETIDLILSYRLNGFKGQKKTHQVLKKAEFNLNRNIVVI